MPTRRNYSTIYYDGRTRLQNNTPVNNFNPQSTTKGYLDIIATEMERLYDAGDYLSKVLDPTRNVGLDLENIGFLLKDILAWKKPSAHHLWLLRRLNESALHSKESPTL